MPSIQHLRRWSNPWASNIGIFLFDSFDFEDRIRNNVLFFPQIDWWQFLEAAVIFRNKVIMLVLNRS